MTYLYVIAHPSGWRKIGYSQDPVRRANQHQSKSGAPLIGEAVVECANPKHAEKKAHRILHDRRIMGEWFNVSRQEAVTAIESASGQKSTPFPEIFLTPPRAPSLQSRGPLPDPAGDHAYSVLSASAPDLTKTQMYRVLSEKEYIGLWFEGHPRWENPSDAQVERLQASFLRTFYIRSLNEARRGNNDNDVEKIADEYRRLGPPWP